METDLLKITQEEFEQIHRLHLLWIKSSQEDGKMADLSNLDLSHLEFAYSTDLSYANLAGANLYNTCLVNINLFGANLSHSNLNGVNLSYADLTGANLSYANLTSVNLHNANLNKANLQEAILIDVNLNDASLKGALINEAILSRADLERRDFFKKEEKRSRVLNRNSDDEKQNKLKELEFERDLLMNEKIESFEKIESKEKQIQELKEELEKRGQGIETGLISAFGSLLTANKDIDAEIKRLESLYVTFLWASFLLVIPLIGVWVMALINLWDVDFNYTRLLLYTCPSLIIVGFICGCVVEMNRAQRQLVSLRKFNRRYSVIKIALEGYYGVMDKIDRTPLKAQETFDAIIQDNINNSFDTDKEEEKIQNVEAKDAFLQEKAIDKCLKILQAFKKE